MRLIRSITVSLFILSVFTTSAQQKLYTYDQLFKTPVANITKPLPAIRGWADDDHYLESRKEDTGNRQQLYAVNVKTGKAVLFEEKKEEPKPTPSATALGLNNNEKNITFSPDGRWAAYTRNNNLLVMDVASKKEIALTTDGSDVILNGYASWIYFEEILGRASRYRAFWWSPDSKTIAFMRFDDTQVPVFPIYVSDGQHGSLENQHYPKPGDKNPEVRIGIVQPDNPSKTVWADFNPKDDQYFGTPVWTSQNKLWVQWMNRGQDNLKLYEIDMVQGSKKEIYDEKQPSWIDLDETSRVQFVSNRGFILKSDKDGWENLYFHDMNGKQLNSITTGNFWGTSILKVDERTNTVYLRARKENTARFDVYRVQLDGKGLQRLTFGDFSHDQVNISPTGKYFITTYSNLSTPQTMALVDNKGKVVKELGNAKGSEFNTYAMPRSEIIRVPSADGLFQLPVLITYPVNFDASKKYPVIVSVYGGPNAGTVYDRYRPAAGLNQWWSQEGVIQVSFDNRSSGHFGKKGTQLHTPAAWQMGDRRLYGVWPVVAQQAIR